MAGGMTKDQFSQLVSQYERLVYTVCFQLVRDAAAAVALALTVLWGGQEIQFSHPVLPETRRAAVEHLHAWPERWNDALSETLSGVTDFFDGLRPGNNS